RHAGFDLHSVREHVEGESLRRVHWPSTARRGELMVRELEDAPRDEIAVLLDADAYAVAGESFDAQVRAAASILAVHIVRGRGARPSCFACKRQEYRSRSFARERICVARSKASSSRRPRMLRTIVLSLVAGSVMAADWLRLERPSHAFWRALALLGLAIVPALVRPWWGRAAALGVAILAGAAVSFSLSAHALWSSPGTLFEQLGRRFAGGVADFYAFRLPVDPGEHARMHMLILFAIFAFTALLAQTVAARIPIAAVVCFVVAAGWPSTLLAGGHELGRGAFI